MADVPINWSKRDNRLLFHLECKDFKHAVTLINEIAEIAEELNHHPDISLKNYKELDISITSHDAGTLTDKDYKLAELISQRIKL